MDYFFMWLFDKYVIPQIDEDSFPYEYQKDKQEWMEEMETFPPTVRLQCEDMMANVRDQWGMRALALGVHLGITMMQEFKGFEKNLYDFPRREMI